MKLRCCKLPFFCMFLLLALPFATWAGEFVKTASEADYPPFSYLDEAGVATGFDVEITKALCKEMRRDCEIILMGFDEILPAVVQGKLDMAVAGFGATPERSKSVDFTDHYYRSHSIFIEKTKGTGEVQPLVLKGKRIGTQADTIQENYLRKIYGNDITLILKPDFEEIFKELQAGRVDFVLIDALSGYTYLKTELGNGLEPLEEPVIAPELDIRAHIAVSKKNSALREDLNKAIQAILRNGEYNRINNKYFDFNIY